MHLFDSMSVWGEALLILALTLVNALFAGAEIAILSVRKSRLRELLEHGVGSARAVLRLRERPEQFLATVQVGITLVATAAAASGGATIGGVLSSRLALLGVAPALAEDLALVAVIVAITYLEVVVGELVPKSLALRSGERFALLAGRPLLFLSIVVRPVVWILTASANVVLRPFRDTTTFTEARFSKDELQQILDEAATAGTLEPSAAEIASRALDFQHVHVNALMVPRNEMVVIDANATWDETWEIFSARKHTRVLVSEGDPYRIAGYITLRDAIAAKQVRAPDIRSIIRRVEVVPEDALASDVLALMQKKQALIVVVADARGGVSGLVTLEDLIEELVGEIFEEHETISPRIRREGDGRALVDGATPVRELNRELGLVLPTSKKWVTLGGLVLSRTGGSPRVGAKLELDGTQIEVVEASPHRITRARVAWTPKPREAPLHVQGT